MRSLRQGRYAFSNPSFQCPYIPWDRHDPHAWAFLAFQSPRNTKYDDATIDSRVIRPCKLLFRSRTAGCALVDESLVRHKHGQAKRSFLLRTDDDWFDGWQSRGLAFTMRATYCRTQSQIRLLPLEQSTSQLMCEYNTRSP